jgi:thiol-disulfide isomerase/thioredoxin
VQTKPPGRALQILLLCLLWASATQAQDLPPLTHKLTPIKTPSVAPELIFENMDEETVDLKDYRGKVVVVNFWATWCPPCRREMGSMERLYQATRDSKVEILAVNIGEDLDTVFSFLDVSAVVRYRRRVDEKMESQGLAHNLHRRYRRQACLSRDRRARIRSPRDSRGDNGPGTIRDSMRFSETIDVMRQNLLLPSRARCPGGLPQTPIYLQV